MFQDLKVAIRHLLHAPGFALMAVLMLALGIGATTAIFSIVEGVLLRPLPFPHADRLVVLSDTIQGAEIDGNDEAGVTGPDVVNYTRDTHSFTALGGYQQTGYELSGPGEPAQVNGARMTAGVFAALEVQPLLGRVFTAEEDQQHVSVAVLSYATWQNRFHGAADILGQKILLDRKPYVVIGVMPRNFEFPLVPGKLNQSELWVPMSFDPAELSGAAQANWTCQMVGRLAPGMTPTMAQEDAERVAQETMRNYPAFMAGLRIRPIVAGLHHDAVQQARPLVRTLFLAVAVVLLIACANLAGLLLVRAIRRRREIAVRMALGSGTAVLLRQTVLESLVLSVTGGLVGLGLAASTLHVGLRLLPDTLPLVGDIRLDWAVVGFALGVAILTGVLCGLVPAFAALRTPVNETLREGGRTGTAGSGHARLRSILVVTEIAIALVLLCASGLLLRSFEKMREANLGYRPDHVLVAGFNLPRKQYGTQATVDQFDQELLRRMQALPGVRDAGLTSFLPANGNQGNSAFVADGYVPRKPGAIDLATPIVVEGDYFSAIGTPLLRGRLLTPEDKAGSQLVVVVNQELAQESWPGQNPIGKRIRLGTLAMSTPWATVVGEVPSVKEGAPDAKPRQQFYVAIDQIDKMLGSLGSPENLNLNGGFITLRTAMPPEQMENALRSTVRSMDPQLPLTQMQTLEHAVLETETTRRFNTALISTFAAAAVLLAILGIYSVIAFTVALRTQEMAIRVALGAQRSGIRSMVFAWATKLTLIGCVLGLAGAVAASHLLRTFLFDVSPFDPVVLVLAAVSVLLLALLASLIPAQRAAAVDPTRALRSE